MNKLIEKIQNIEFEHGEADFQSMYDIVDELQNIPKARDVIPKMFEFFELNADKIVGSPGPFVHFIEERNDYHKMLKASVRRLPAPITVWMVNRILNAVTDEKERSEWMILLRDVHSHPEANSNARRDANDFLQLQERKRSDS